MTGLDWAIVLLLNGGVIAFGFWLARGSESSSQWFLGARALPWWGIGLSMFGTNVDNADLVGVTGNAFKEGLHIISVYAIGSAAGGILAAFFVVPVIYRAGFYTNAEYLEARFGVSSRVLSALIQLQYRTCMLGLMIYSVFLLLTRMIHMSSDWAWVLIIAAVVLAGCYSALGGLKAVVWTDAFQSGIMLVGGALVLGTIWYEVGGWSGMTASLESGGEVNGIRLADLPHAGRYRGSDGATSPWMIALAWTIVGCGYWTVNHTQTMRLMGARSLWDMKMAAVFGVALSMPVMIGCALLGVFARALPEFQALPADEADFVFPRMADQFLGVGVKGLVVAAVVAAAVSTFDSMGSSLSAIFTRDIYARLFRREASDRHYVWVSRIATLLILASGFLYLPYIMSKENMLSAFTNLISVFVTPLLTLYVLGVLTSVSRVSGWIGLLVGAVYGVVALAIREDVMVAILPDLMTDKWMAFTWSALITSATMAIVTAVGRRTGRVVVSEFRESGWLERTRESLPALREHPFAERVPWWACAGLWATLLALVSIWVVFVAYW